MPLMVRVDDYAELAALVAEREERRALETAAEPASERALAAAEPAGESSDTSQAGSGTVFAPLFTARAAAVSAAARLLIAWEDADLRQLACDERAPARAWAHALDLCSRTPGDALPAGELLRGADSAVRTSLGNQAALDRLLIRRYRGLGRPVRLVSGAQLGHHDDQQYWVVSHDQATAWRRVREGRLR